MSQALQSQNNKVSQKPETSPEIFEKNQEKLDFQDFNILDGIDFTEKKIITENVEKKLEVNENYQQPFSEKIPEIYGNVSEFAKTNAESSPEIKEKLNALAIGGVIALIELLENSSPEKRKEFLETAKTNPAQLDGVANLKLLESQSLVIISSILLSKNLPENSAGKIIQKNWGTLVESVAGAFAVVEENQQLFQDVGTLTKESIPYIQNSSPPQQKTQYTKKALGIAGAIGGAILGGKIGGGGMPSIFTSLAGSAIGNIGAKVGYDALDKKDFSKSFASSVRRLLDTGEYAVSHTGNEVKKIFSKLKTPQEKIVGGAIGLAVLYGGYKAISSFFSNDSSEKNDDEKSRFSWKKAGILGLIGLAGIFGFFKLDWMKKILSDEANEIIEKGKEVTKKATEIYNAGDEKFSEIKTYLLEKFPNASPEVKNFIKNRKFYEILVLAGIPSLAILKKILSNPIKSSRSLFSFFFSLKGVVSIGVMAGLAYSFGLFPSKEESEKFFSSTKDVQDKKSFLEKGLIYISFGGEKVKEYWEKNILPVISSWKDVLNDSSFGGIGKIDFEKNFSLENIKKEIIEDPHIKTLLLKNENIGIKEGGMRFGYALVSLFAIKRLAKILKKSKKLKEFITAKNISIGLVIYAIYLYMKSDGHILDDTVKNKIKKAYSFTKDAIDSALQSPIIQKIFKEGGEYAEDIKLIFGIADIKEIPKEKVVDFRESLVLLRDNLDNFQKGENTENKKIYIERTKKNIEFLLQFYTSADYTNKNFSQEHFYLYIERFSEILRSCTALGMKVDIHKNKNDEYVVLYENEKGEKIQFPPLPFNPSPELLPYEEVPKEQKELLLKHLDTLASDIEARDENFPQYKKAVKKIKEMKEFIARHKYSQYTKEKEKEFLKFLNSIEGISTKNGADHTIEITFEYTNKSDEVEVFTTHILRAEVLPQQYLQVRPFIQNKKGFSNSVLEVIPAISNDIESVLARTLIENILNNTSDKNDPLFLLAKEQKKKLEETGTVDFLKLFGNAFFGEKNSYTVNFKDGMFTVLTQTGKELFATPIVTLGKNLRKVFDPEESLNWDEIIRESYAIPLLFTVGAVRGFREGRILAVSQGSSRIFTPIWESVKGGTKFVTTPLYIAGKHSLLTLYRLRHPLEYMRVKGRNFISHVQGMRFGTEVAQAKRYVLKAERIQRNINFWTKKGTSGSGKFGMNRKILLWRHELEALHSNFNHINYAVNTKKTLEDILEERKSKSLKDALSSSEPSRTSISSEPPKTSSSSSKEISPANNNSKEIKKTSSDHKAKAKTHFSNKKLTHVNNPHYSKPIISGANALKTQTIRVEPFREKELYSMKKPANNIEYKNIPKERVKQVEKISKKFPKLKLKAVHILPMLQYGGYIMTMNSLHEISNAKDANQALAKAIPGATLLSTATILEFVINAKNPYLSAVVAVVLMSPLGEDLRKYAGDIEQSVSDYMDKKGLSQEYYIWGENIADSISFGVKTSTGYAEEGSFRDLFESLYRDWDIWKGFDETRAIDFFSGHTKFILTDAEISDWNTDKEEDIEELRAKIFDLESAIKRRLKIEASKIYNPKKHKNFNEAIRELYKKKIEEYKKYLSLSEKERESIKSKNTSFFYFKNTVLGYLILKGEKEAKIRYLETQKINKNWYSDQYSSLYQSFKFLPHLENGKYIRNKNNKKVELKNDVEGFEKIEAFLNQVLTYKRMGKWDDIFDLYGELKNDEEAKKEKENLRKNIETYINYLKSKQNPYHFTKDKHSGIALRLRDLDRLKKIENTKNS